METKLGITESNFIPSKDVHSFMSLKPALGVLTGLATPGLQVIFEHTSILHYRTDMILSLLRKMHTPSHPCM